MTIEHHPGRIGRTWAGALAALAFLLGTGLAAQASTQNGNPSAAQAVGALQSEVLLPSVTHPQPQSASRPGTARLEPYLEIELLRLEETYRVMDKFARKIWPGWKNYPEIEFGVQYPNLVFLLVNPRGKVPEGYEVVPGRTVRGRPVYLNRKEELPVKVEPPLTGGGGGGLSIHIWLQGIKFTEEQQKAEAEARAKNDPSYQPAGSSDNEILLYVHEFFHGFQRRAMKESKGGAQEDRNFASNAEYATYSNVEGLALLAAFKEKDRKKALEDLQDYSVARELKHKFMTPGAIAFETNTTVSEGTASYSDAKMAMLIRDKKYKPAMTRKDDPYFFGFKYANAYAYEKTVAAAEHIMGVTLNTLGKCYTYGLLQCLLLDRLFPGWKAGFFETGKNLDEVTAARLHLTDPEKAAVAARFKTKYKYDELYAKHAGVIKERDDAKALIMARKGRRYVIDLQKTKEIIVPEGRGKFVTIGVEGLYLHGINDFALGDVLLTTADTPIHKPFLWTIEWVDTDAKPGEKGYDLTFEKKDGETYRNVVFQTAGFTLKAPEVEIKEDAAKNEVRVVILRKVAR